MVTQNIRIWGASIDSGQLIFSKNVWEKLHTKASFFLNDYQNFRFLNQVRYRETDNGILFSLLDFIIKILSDQLICHLTGSYGHFRFLPV